MESVAEKKLFKMLDIAKLLSAIMIIALHTTPFADINILVDKLCIGICRFAVPFFFFASAYLFFLKLEPMHHLKDYVLKTCRYWIFFSIIAIIFLKPRLGFGILRTFLFDGYGVYWFFHGMIVSVSMICLLIYISSNRNMTLLYTVPCLLYIMGVLLNTYFSILPESVRESIEKFYFTTFVTARNGLFGGTLYALIGYHMAITKKSKYKKPVLYFGVSLAIFFMELMISWKYTEKIHGREMFFTMPFLVVSFFGILLELEKRFGNRINPTFCFYCRKISFAMFGWQTLYLVIIPETMNTMVRFLLITVLTIITGIVLIQLTKIPKLRTIMNVMI